MSHGTADIEEVGTGSTRWIRMSSSPTQICEVAKRASVGGAVGGAAGDEGVEECDVRRLRRSQLSP